MSKFGSVNFITKNPESVNKVALQHRKKDLFVIYLRSPGPDARYKYHISLNHIFFTEDSCYNEYKMIKKTKYYQVVSLKNKQTTPLGDRNKKIKIKCRYICRLPFSVHSYRMPQLAIMPQEVSIINI